MDSTIIVARYIEPGRPLAVVDMTGGVVQGEYLYEGTGVPELVVLDFDREEASLEELMDFRWDTVECAAVAITGRTDHPDDLAQVAEWRQHADDMIENATLGGD